MSDNDTTFDPQQAEFMYLVGQAVDLNSTKAAAPWARSTALRTSGLRQRSASTLADNRCAEEFLLNTRLVRDDRQNDASILHYFEDATTKMISLAERRLPETATTVALPPSAPMRMALDGAVERRRSVRSYTGDPMPLDYLAAILRAGVGFTGEADVTLTTGSQVQLKFRATPSGGGLMPISLYVAAMKVTGLEPGYYRYDPNEDALVLAGPESIVEGLRGAVAFPEEVITLSRANAMLMFVAKPWRSMRKYGNRGMRLVFMEAGYIAQNIHLASTALGFGSLDCSGVYDDEAHEAMGIDGLYETLAHTVILGCPS